MVSHHAPAAVIAAVLLVCAQSSWAAGAPPRGVYGCYDISMGTRPGSMQFMPMPVVMFGLIDAATYSDYDGHRGHYTYDAAAGTITMTDGSREGWRYRKVEEWSFTLIDNKTGRTIYTCPLDAAKNPEKGPW